MSQVSFDTRECPKCKREVKYHNSKGNVRKTDKCKLNRGQVCHLLNVRDPMKVFRFGSRASVLKDVTEKLGL